MLAAKPGRGGDSEKELAAVGVGAGVSHGQFAGRIELMRRVFSLILKSVAGTAHAIARGVAALNHEVGNHAMKNGAVVELARGLGARGRMRPLFGAFRKRNKVSHGDGRLCLKQANGDLAFVGVEDGVSSFFECHECSWIKFVNQGLGAAGSAGSAVAAGEGGSG